LLKRMNMFVAVAALMAVMLLVSAAVAFAVPDPTDPKTLCKGDFLAVAGLDAFGEPTILFTNQGQCVSFVEGGGTVQLIEETT
jgi:hypothetical protein